MDLLASIASVKPREKSGSIAAARFEFQLNASFLKILEWHASEKDYVAIFDFIDDLVLIIDPKSNGKALLYQIKSKGSGSWTIAEVVRLESGEPPRSVVGKMYSG